MADKKKDEKTDEEWAQLVADKVHEATQRMGQEARAVLGTSTPEDMVSSNNDVNVRPIHVAEAVRAEAMPDSSRHEQAPRTQENRDAFGRKVSAMNNAEDRSHTRRMS